MCEVELPKIPRELPDNALSNCHGLEEVRTAEGPEVVGDTAFAGSGLDLVSVPANVRETRISALSGAGDSGSFREVRGRVAQIGSGTILEWNFYFRICFIY